MFEYRRTPGSILVIVLQEVVSNAGVRSTIGVEVEKSAVEVIAGRAATPPRTKFVAHASVSAEDVGALIRRSFDVVLNGSDLKRSLLIKKGEPLLFLQGDAVDSAKLPGLEPASNEQIKYKLKNREAVDYFEFCCVDIHGKAVRVTLNYHTPSVNGQVIIRRGTTIEFSYYKEQNSFVLKDVKTSHF